jgi:hypothetical protein
MFEIYQGYINFLIMKKSRKLQTIDFNKLMISKLNQNQHQIKGGYSDVPVKLSEGCQEDSAYTGATC